MVQLYFISFHFDFISFEDFQNWTRQLNVNYQRNVLFSLELNRNLGEKNSEGVKREIKLQFVRHVQCTWNIRKSKQKKTSHKYCFALMGTFLLLLLLRLYSFTYGSAQKTAKSKKFIFILIHSYVPSGMLDLIDNSFVMMVYDTPLPEAQEQA